MSYLYLSLLLNTSCRQHTEEAHDVGRNVCKYLKINKCCKKICHKINIKSDQTRKIN